MPEGRYICRCSGRIRKHKRYKMLNNYMKCCELWNIESNSLQRRKNR
uniref:Uncharacterized protein n=1 Tax=Escherichia coli TaxID=562 RepID=A0A8A2XMM4_ECOLX|nr:hypothetical protein [Escherichia coli]